MIKLLFSFFIFSFSANVFAIGELLYHGKPLHPSCFTSLLTINNKSFSLDQCSKSKDQVSTKEGYYTTQDDNGSQHQYTRYTVIGSKEEKFLVISGAWTGGSGFFSNVSWVTIQNNQLILLKSLASGDRCNNGIDKVSEWQYAVNKTPFAMMTENSNEANITGEELDDSAAGCAAKAVYRFDPFKQETSFEYMRLQDEPLPIEEYLRALKYQLCFNKLYYTYVMQGRINLQPKDLEQFRNQFMTYCSGT